MNYYQGGLMRGVVVFHKTGRVVKLNQEVLVRCELCHRYRPRRSVKPVDQIPMCRECRR